MRPERLMSFIGLLTLFMTSISLSENIDPYDANNQYAWAENVGWVNFEPNAADPNAGVQVSSDKLTGFIWSENIGWINLSPQSYGGVLNDGYGNLSGYAWAENVGWISFSCDNTGSCGAVNYGVTIDTDGSFDGWAWGENIGWINFGLTDYYVAACKVKFEDLANFVDNWLASGFVPGNLDGLGDVDFQDYSVFASYWLDYCPDSWPLK